MKKEALRKTGIGYHEVVAGHTKARELRRLVEKLVPGVVANQIVSRNFNEEHVLSSSQTAITNL